MVADLRLQCLSALGASRTSPYLPTLFVGTLSSVPFGFGCISHTGTVSGALKATKSSVPFGFWCISHDKAVELFGDEFAESSVPFGFGCISHMRSKQRMFAACLESSVPFGFGCISP